MSSDNVLEVLELVIGLIRAVLRAVHVIVNGPKPYQDFPSAHSRSRSGVGVSLHQLHHPKDVPERTEGSSAHFS